MGTPQEKSIKKAPIKGSSSKELSFVLKPDSVNTEHLKERAVTLSRVAADTNVFAETSSGITFREEALRNVLKINTPSDTWDHSGDDSIATSGLIRDKLDTKQNTIADLSTIRSNAQTGFISIQNIRNLMNACNEVFRIGFIGYHIEMSAEPDEQGDYTFNIVMNA